MTKTETMGFVMDLCKDPLNIKILFLMNDMQPMDFSSTEIHVLLNGKQHNFKCSLKHVRDCVNTLKKFDILRTSRKISGQKLYTFNNESPIGASFIELYNQIEDNYSVITNTPPKPQFVDKKYYEDKPWASKWMD